MSDEKIKLRVERLLYGSLEVEDITRLLLSIRDRSFGHQPVREIGDFVAHADQREKGVITDEVRDFFSVLRFIVPYFENSIDLQNLPITFPSAMQANLRRISPELVKKETGLKSKAAKRILASLLQKFVISTQGVYQQRRTLDTNELSLLNCLLRHVVARPAFSDEKLFAELSIVLTKNRLINASDADAMTRLKPAITLYAVSCMHQCRILLGDGTHARLLAAPHGEGGTIVVTAIAATPTATFHNLNMAGPIFSTNLMAEDWCEAEMLENMTWEHEIEMTKQVKLKKMEGLRSIERRDIPI